MKTLSARFLLLISLALVVGAVTACKTNSETEVSQTSTVIGLAGHARYHDGRSDPWRAVRLGTFIPQGSVIQTDDGPTNAIQLDIGRRIRYLPSWSHPDFEQAYHLTLYGKSVLKLDRVDAKTVSGKKISDIRLILSVGSANCYIGYAGPNDVFPSPPPSRGPKLETIKPQPGKSYFEIRSSNVVVHAECANLFFSPLKVASLLSGVAALEFTDTGTTKDLFAYQKYDFDTGEISQVEFGSGSGPDYFWHYLSSEPDRDTPPYKVPQRPF